MNTHPVPNIDPSADRLRQLIERESGIRLMPDKTALLRARLGKRLRSLGLTTLAEYADYVSDPRNRDEIGALLSAITTNHTAFFRESHHFTTLREDALKHAEASAVPYRVWSAGCSTGQEPYSAAMALNAASGPNRLSFRIFASDIDKAALAVAKAGTYEAKDMTGVPSDMRQRHFKADGDQFRIDDKIRAFVEFEQSNLHAAWTARPAFDAIFCRNVVIYFDRQAQTRLWQRICDRLKPGGLLFIGHSETIPPELRSRLEPLETTTFRRIAS